MYQLSDFDRIGSLRGVISVAVVAVTCLLATQSASAQDTTGIVDYNVNVTGTCAPPYELEDGTII